MHLVLGLKNKQNEYKISINTEKMLKKIKPTKSSHFQNYLLILFKKFRQIRASEEEGTCKRSVPGLAKKGS